MIVDFHSHTNESDGTLAPDALAALMTARGVEIFSITDHDSLGAYGKFEAAARARVVTGVEINTTWHDNEVHILGYRLPLHPDSALIRLLERNRDERRRRVDRMVAQMQAAGHDISVAEVVAEAKPWAALGRPHMAKALIRKGITSGIESAFRDFLRRGKPGYVPSVHITPQEAIDAIVAEGGTPVLAHPGRLKDYEIIDELAANGLRGLEVFYPAHERAHVQHFRDTATRLGLVMTAGSDFHDARYNKRGVGMDVERADIAPFLDLIA